MRRAVIAILMGCALFYGAVVCYLLLVGDKAVFHLQPASYRQETCRFIPGQHGRRIALRAIPSPGARYTLLYSHGSSGDMGNLDPLVEAHRRFGFNVVIYDYPGVGLSTGPVSEQGCYETIDDVYHFVQTELQIPPEQMILYGRSIGTGPSLYLAEKEKVAGVILVSAFTSALGVDFLPSLFPFDKFPNAKRILHVRAPILLLHGTADANVPSRESVKLHALAPENSTLCLIDGAGHTDVHAVPAYWKALNQFMHTIDPNMPESNKEPAAE